MSMKKETCYRGIVLKESLLTCELPLLVRSYLEDTYPYRLDGKVPMTVFKLRVPVAQSEEVADKIARALRPERFFSQLTGEADMLVVFPAAWIRVIKGRPDTAEAARTYGVEHGIPRHQMRFEEMFERDHPNEGNA